MQPPTVTRSADGYTIPSTTTVAARYAPPVKRPTSVTILSFLAIVGGNLALILSIAFLVAGGQAAVQGLITGGVGGLLIVALLVILALSILYIVVGVAAWQLRAWAWPVAVLLQGMAINFYVIFLLTGVDVWWRQLIGLAVAILMVYYLYRPEVKKAFGRV